MDFYRIDEEYNRKQILSDNSCAFRVLEDGCREYIEKYLST